jgi:hypothetical protein
MQLLATTYYVSDNSGNDNNNGTSTATPWKTLAKVSSTNFNPGDIILFKAGETWVGQLVITSSGTSGAPVVYGKYGTGNLPYLACQGTAKTTIYSFNKQYVELTDLKVTNTLPGNDINDPDDSLLLAVNIVNADAGTLNHIYLTRMEITKVNSQHKSSGSIYYGGVLFDIAGTATPSKWNDVVISNCNFHDLSRTGITFRTDWEVRSSTSTFGQSLPNGYTDNWVPSTNIIFRDNIFKKITGNGLVIRVATGTLIESNLFDSCAYQISGNATFCFNTDGTVFQFNEAKNTIYNGGDTDARGIDVDFRCKNTIVQYNYLHDNGRGGFVATGGNEDGSAYERFNVGTILRYNILEDNERIGIAISGNCYNMTVHNNVIFASTAIANDSLVKCYPWSPANPHDISFYSNIFWAKGTGARFYHAPTVSNITYRHNLYNWTSTPPTDLPVVGYSSNANIAEDGFSAIGNPLFNLPGGSKSGYHLEAGSPAFNVGIRGLSQPALDIYNNTIGNTRNIGVDQTPGASTTEYKIDINHTDNGSITAGWTGLVGTNGNTLAINGVRFTIIGSQGTRDRGTAGNVTRDFSFADGASAATGIRMEYLPAGVYDVSTWQYDPNFPGLINIEYREDGLPGTMVVKASGKSLTSSAATTFQITVQDGKDYELLVREASAEDRSRFNGITITPAGMGRTSGNGATEEQAMVVSDALKIFPNPASAWFIISKKISQDDQLTISITDIQGRSVYSRNQPVSAGNWQLKLDRNELKLVRGVYRVTVTSTTGKGETAAMLVF